MTSKFDKKKYITIIIYAQSLQYIGGGWCSSKNSSVGKVLKWMRMESMLMLKSKLIVRVCSSGWYQSTNNIVTRIGVLSWQWEKLSSGIKGLCLTKQLIQIVAGIGSGSPC
jgi:hypothetical protein